MKSVSPAVKLAIQIAAFESLQAGSEFIEKEHLLIGILKLRVAGAVDAIRNNRHLMKDIMEEKKAIDFPLQNAGIRPDMFYRCIRLQFGKRVFVHKTKVLHRSTECKRCFGRAGQLAHDKEITCVHLFIAIMENPGEIIADCIKRMVSGQKPVGDPELPLSMQVSQSVKAYEKALKEKETLSQVIEHSRKDLFGKDRDSPVYRNMRGDLRKKTCLLARMCINTGDIAGLIASLKELVSESGTYDQGIGRMISQLEFMQREEIGISEATRKKVFDMLDAFEAQAK
ncbi:Clp protease N-terminal domain-containing protein [Methanoregula sp.]|uniref:Clp protease N-terminal domain-containing protein n=1 Tax=Methanoregula sp. TaxID=2052170 RepID=UPI000CB701CC|nr:Clp protease N-terminal domain-containing protein [Methanoregula sp.]PKG31495.1 MAG: hypothetical protein CW742_13105 [Methanoregula sp.]